MHLYINVNGVNISTVKPTIVYLNAISATVAIV